MMKFIYLYLRVSREVQAALLCQLLLGHRVPQADLMDLVALAILEVQVDHLCQVFHHFLSLP